MYRIIDGRSQGKTSRLLLLAKETGAVVVCSNPAKMREKAHFYGITGLDIVSYGDYTKRNYDINKSAFIDELESYMKSLDNNFNGYTISEE